jgi:hypothetical protein
MSTGDKVISWPPSHDGQQCVYPIAENQPCYGDWKIDMFCDSTLNQIYFFDPYLNGFWEDPNHWWIDSNHTIPYLVVPPANSSDLTVIIDSPVLSNSGSIPSVGLAIFNASNAIEINGNAEFRGSGTTNTGIINGNVKVKYPAQGPIGGTVTGDIEYIGFPTPPDNPLDFRVAIANDISFLNYNQSWKINAEIITECGSVFFDFKNQSDHYLYYSISGFVNDDIEINGVVYENGKYPFWNPAPCGRVNGSHTFNYPQSGRIGLARGNGVYIRALDNGGGGDPPIGSISANLVTSLTPY